MKLKLFLISQDTNLEFDTYACAVVAAEDEASAKKFHPCGYMVWSSLHKGWVFSDNRKKYEDDSWVVLKNVKCKYLGEASEGIQAGVICAGFNAAG